MERNLRIRPGADKDVEEMRHIFLIYAILLTDAYSMFHVKLQLHDAIYRLRFYSNLSIHISSLPNSHSDVASAPENRRKKIAPCDHSLS